MTLQSRPKRAMLSAAHGAFLVAALVTVGCAQSGDSPAPGVGGATGSGGANGGTGGAGGGNAMTGCPDAPARLKAGCQGGACHDPMNEIIWGDLVSDGVAARLINVTARMSTPCNGQTKLVNPDKPARGVLFERLTTTTCGSPPEQMPSLDATADQRLSDSARASLVACLKSWLEPQLK